MVRATLILTSSDPSKFKVSYCEPRTWTRMCKS